MRIDFTYTTDGKIDVLTRYSDAAATQVIGSTDYNYFSDGSIDEILHKNAAGTVIADYSYTYDNGQVATQTVNGVTTTYSYDAQGQLTGDGSNSYSYDANGNRTMTGYETGTANRLLSDGIWTYSYDEGGPCGQNSQPMRKPRQKCGSRRFSKEISADGADKWPRIRAAGAGVRWFLG